MVLSEWFQRNGPFVGNPDTVDRMGKQINRIESCLWTKVFQLSCRKAGIDFSIFGPQSSFNRHSSPKQPITVGQTFLPHIGGDRKILLLGLEKIVMQNICIYVIVVSKQYCEGNNVIIRMEDSQTFFFHSCPLRGCLSTIIPIGK